MIFLLYLVIGLVLSVPIGRILRSHLPEKAARYYGGGARSLGQDTPAPIAAIAIGLGLFWPITAAFGAVYLGITKGGK